ncbi:MAG: amidohydrolase family protein [Candidatus ainarchaeum sp.]|nr:amidohydrolase family protein [Candidatus ainarchaeum sp.]
MLRGKIIDSHVHAYSRKELDVLSKSMKKAGIAKSIMLYWPGIPPVKTPSLQETIANVSRHKNIFMAGSLKISDFENIGKNCALLETALKKRQIIGIKLMTGYEPVYPNDPRLEPVYELASKFRVPVLFHMGDTWSGVPGAKVRFAQPLYVDDVAVDYPKLKLVICHLGNPWIMDSAEVLYKNKNVYADMSGILSFPGRYEKFSNALLHEKILGFIGFVGKPKILFGSDYFGKHLYSQEQCVEFLEGFTELSKQEIMQVACKNAEKLFDLSD